MSLSNNDVTIILGMIARGDKQHDIAAWFGENQARIVEAEKGSHGSLAAAPADKLPPKGAPGPKGYRLSVRVGVALKKLEAGETDEGLEVLKEALARYSSNSN